MQSFNTITIFLFLISYVFSETCLINNFENHNSLFNHGNRYCDTSSATWKVGNYTSTIRSPHENSKLFIKPNDSTSCISSDPMSMSAGGVLEVNLFMDDATPSNEIKIVVKNIVSDDVDENVGYHCVSPVQEGFVSGWQSIRITLQGTERFEGYIVIRGSASKASDLLIDSFRYIPPRFDEEQCLIYYTANEKEQIDTITPKNQIRPDSCVTYDFEQDFDTKFSNTLGPCLNMALWKLGDYSTHLIDSPHSSSNWFIAPGEQFSCVSSFLFQMAAAGTIEVNAFINTTTPIDHVAVLVHQINQNGNDGVVASIFPTQDTDSSNGWQTLRATVSGAARYEGYITFMGVASDNSVILIDSFRYIPPYVVNNELCSIYDIIYESEENETITIPPEVCVTYNFEQDFDNLFTNTSGICTSTMESWELKNYDSLFNIFQRPHPSSNWFINPRETVSCLSSFSFQMSAMGIIEIKSFVETSAISDFISIIVTQIVADGNDAVVASISFPTGPGHHAGWQNLRATLTGTGQYKGKIYFLGSSANNSTILIDSFRYIPPSYYNDEDQCIIYDDSIEITTTSIPESNETKLPSTIHPDITRPPPTSDTDSTTTFETNVTDPPTYEPDIPHTSSTNIPEASESSPTPDSEVTYSSTYKPESTYIISTNYESDVSESSPTLNPEVTYSPPYEPEGTYTPSTYEPEISESTLTVDPEVTYSLPYEPDTKIPSTYEPEFSESSITPDSEVTYSSTYKTEGTNTPAMYEPEVSESSPTLNPEVTYSPPYEPEVTNTSSTYELEISESTPTVDPEVTYLPSYEPDNETSSTYEQEFSESSLIYEPEDTNTTSTFEPEVTNSSSSESDITYPTSTIEPCITDPSVIINPPTSEPDNETDHPIIVIPVITDPEFWLVIIIVALIALLIVILCMFLCYCCYQCGKKKGTGPKENLPHINIVNNNGTKMFK